MPDKIIVVVEGGLVQGVFCTEALNKVEVLDWDEYNDEDCTPEDKLRIEKLQAEYKSQMFQIY